MMFFAGFIIVFLILGVLLGLFKKNTYIDQHDEPKTGGFGRLALALIIAIIVGLVHPIAITRIDAGNVGLKIDKVGNNKGIPVAVPVKGWVFYNDWTSEIVEYSIRQNHVAYKNFSVTTKGGFPIQVAPSFNYALKPEKAADVYINLLKGGSFSSLEETWLQTATNIAMTNASNGYTIDSIFNNKQHYQQDVINELNKELSAYFLVSQINPGVVPPPELAEVIKNKTETIQKAQQAELDKLTAQAEAETKIARARGDSAQAVIEAAGRAQAVKLEQQQLTPLYIEFLKVKTWKGEVPTTVAGGGTGFLINLGKN
jgi:regulator of protease activity HflC (stomatin/prohibitin superfamily)